MRTAGPRDPSRFEAVNVDASEQIAKEIRLLLETRMLLEVPLAGLAAERRRGVSVVSP